MVTLFGRWNKRLLLNKSLSGGGTTDTLWTLKHFNLSRLNCPPSFIYYFLLFSEMHIYKTRWRVWKHCLLPAVWSKPASWENSPTHHPTKFITSFMSETLPDDVVDCDTGLQRTFQILQFPFDLHRRNAMCQHSLLLVTFMVHRYRWRESGIFIFLNKGPSLRFCTSLGGLRWIHGESLRRCLRWFASPWSGGTAIAFTNGLTLP